MYQDVLSRATTGSQTRNMPFGRARVVRYTMAAYSLCLQQAFFVRCKRKYIAPMEGLEPSTAFRLPLRP